VAQEVSSYCRAIEFDILLRSCCFFLKPHASGLQDFLRRVEEHSIDRLHCVTNQHQGLLAVVAQNLELFYDTHSPKRRLDVERQLFSPCTVFVVSPARSPSLHFQPERAGLPIPEDKELNLLNIYIPIACFFCSESLHSVLC
jgi:hypothetical protein